MHIRSIPNTNNTTVPWTECDTCRRWYKLQNENTHDCTEPTQGEIEEDEAMEIWYNEQTSANKLKDPFLRFILKLKAALRLRPYEREQVDKLADQFCAQNFTD